MPGLYLRRRTGSTPWTSLKTALEESERSLHDAVFIARQVWEKDCDAVKFDIDDLVQIESALQEICNITAGIDSGDDGE